MGRWLANKFWLSVRSRAPGVLQGVRAYARRSQSARSRGVSLLPRFARETTLAASYWAMVGQQVLAQRPIADPGSFPRRQDLRSRRAKSPEVIEGGGARRGSEAIARDQANGRGRLRPSRSPVGPAGRRCRAVA